MKRRRPLSRECAGANLRADPNNRRAWRWQDSGFAHDRCSYPDDCPCACHFSRLPVSVWIAVIISLGVAFYALLYWIAGSAG